MNWQSTRRPYKPDSVMNQPVGDGKASTGLTTSWFQTCFERERRLVQRTHKLKQILRLSHRAGATDAHGSWSWGGGKPLNNIKWKRATCKPQTQAAEAAVALLALGLVGNEEAHLRNLPMGSSRCNLGWTLLNCKEPGYKKSKYKPSLGTSFIPWTHTSRAPAPHCYRCWGHSHE